MDAVSLAGRCLHCMLAGTYRRKAARAACAKVDHRDLKNGINISRKVVLGSTTKKDRKSCILRGRNKTWFKCINTQTHFSTLIPSSLNSHQLQKVNFVVANYDEKVQSVMNESAMVTTYMGVVKV